MDPVTKAQKIIETAKDVHANGMASTSKSELANLLGMRQSIQFNLDKNPSLDVGLWALKNLSKEGREKHENFMVKNLFIEFTPGQVSDLNELTNVLSRSKKKISEQTKDLVIDVLYHGKPELGRGLTSSQVAQVRSMCKTTLTEMYSNPYSNYLDIESIFADKAKKFNAEFFIQLLTRSTYKKRKEVKEGKVELKPFETGLTHAVSCLDKTKFNELEFMYFQFLEEIERYRYEHYVLIKNIGELMLESDQKLPRWMNFFDKPKMKHNNISPPSLKELMWFYSSLQGIKKMKPSEVLKALKEGSDGKGRAPTFAPMKSIKECIDSGNCSSVLDAKAKLKINLETASIYRQYENWSKTWEFNPYWMSD